MRYDDYLIEDPSLTEDLSDEEIASRLDDDNRREAMLDEQMDIHRDAMRER